MTLGMKSGDKMGVNLVQCYFELERSTIFGFIIFLYLQCIDLFLQLFQNSYIISIGNTMIARVKVD